MKIAVLLCVMSVTACVAGAQMRGLKTMDEIKRWRFEVARGVLDARLSSYATAGQPNETVLSLLEGANSKASFSEQAEALAKIISEMPSLGYSPRDLQMISTGLVVGSDLQERLSLAVSKSREWRSCIGRKYCQVAYPVANQFLKSIDAYKEFDAVLHPRGLIRQNVTVDDMACGIASKTPRSTSSPPTSNPSQVSCVGIVHIVLRRKSPDGPNVR